MVSPSGEAGSVLYEERVRKHLGKHRAEFLINSVETRMTKSAVALGHHLTLQYLTGKKQGQSPSPRSSSNASNELIRRNCF